MMKKIIKNIVLFIISVYFVLSLIYTIYNFNINSLKLEEYEFPGGTKMHVETINLEENVTIMGLINQSFYAGKGVILLNNVQIFIISLIIGSFLGLIISSKKSKFVKKFVKYIVYFILGNIFVNSILSMIYYSKFNYFKEGIFDIYHLILVNLFMLYTVIFFLIIASRVLISKIKNFNNLK